MLIGQITDIHIGFERGNPRESNMVRLESVLARMAAGPDRPRSRPGPAAPKPEPRVPSG